MALLVFGLAFQFGNAELDILPALESGGLLVVKLGDALGGSVESAGIAREEAGICLLYTSPGSTAM